MFESDDLSTYNEERKYKGGRFVEKVRYMISDAAAMAGVESHVLRYWEEELDLTIPRNEMGHRYYTRENIQEFQKIKQLKEQGYQLKAIRFILHNGSMDKPDMRTRIWHRSKLSLRCQVLTMCSHRRYQQIHPQK